MSQIIIARPLYIMVCDDKIYGKNLYILFVHDFEKNYNPIVIGDTSFDKDTKKELLRIASGFSNFATFD